MAGFNSIAAAAIGALNVANTVVSAYSSYKDSGVQEYQQEKARTNLELQQEAAKSEFEKNRLKEEARFVEEERRKSLRNLVAGQKAKYGSGGTGSADGSGQALLLGLFDKSEEERAKEESSNAFKLSEIERNLSNKQRLNTLQLAQLKERTKLKKAGSILDSVTSIF